MSAFDNAIKAIRNGAHTTLTGNTLTVNDIPMVITDEEFDIAWDAMDETHGGIENATISLNGAG